MTSNSRSSVAGTEPATHSDISSRSRYGVYTALRQAMQFMQRSIARDRGLSSQTIGTIDLFHDIAVSEHSTNRINRITFHAIEYSFCS